MVPWCAGATQQGRGCAFTFGACSRSAVERLGVLRGRRRVFYRFLSPPTLEYLQCLAEPLAIGQGSDYLTGTRGHRATELETDMATARPRPQAMRLSDAAASRIKELMARMDRPVAGLRVGVKNGGCAGMEYTMEYAERSVRPTRWSRTRASRS